jgi:hypothetical protein
MHAAPLRLLALLASWTLSGSTAADVRIETADRTTGARQRPTDASMPRLAPALRRPDNAHFVRVRDAINLALANLSRREQRRLLARLACSHAAFRDRQLFAACKDMLHQPKDTRWRTLLNHVLNESSISQRPRKGCTSNLPGTTPVCRKQKVMLLHFSKASGSAVCRLAQAAGCTTWASDGNCGRRQREYADGPWWIPVSHAQSAWERSRFAYPDAIARMGSGRSNCSERLARAPQFHAVESTLPGGVPCPGFFTLAMLRPPLERMVSHSFELARRPSHQSKISLLAPRPVPHL